MYSIAKEGICFGPFSDHKGNEFIAEGETTNSNFVQVPDADIMIRVDSHSAGGNAQLTVRTNFRGLVHFSELVIPEGGSFFGHGGKGPKGMAFTHVKPA